MRAVHRLDDRDQHAVRTNSALGLWRSIILLNGISFDFIIVARHCVLLDADRPLAAVQENGPENCRALVFGCEQSLIVHAAHAATRHCRHPSVLLRLLGHHGFRGDQQPGDRRGVLQSRTHDLGRIDDALGEHVDVLAVLLKPVGILILFQDFADDDGAVLARVDRDLACR